jgi:hypothetical protein
VSSGEHPTVCIWLIASLYTILGVLLYSVKQKAEPWLGSGVCFKLRAVYYLS